MAENGPPIELEPASTALVVIDMQNDYCSPGGDFDKRGISVAPAQGIVPKIQRLLDSARENGFFVLYTAMVFDEFTYEDRHHRIVPERMRDRKLCFRGTWGADVMEELSPRPGERITEKCRYSAFYNTGLDVLLRNRGIKTLVLTGVVTNVCVESTARDAWNRDFDVIVISDATASYSQELHEATLKNVAFHCGAVRTTDEVVQLMEVGMQTVRHTG